MANRHGRQFTRTARRATFWEGVNVDSAVLNNSQNVIAAVSEATLENVPNPTIVRVRGSLTLKQTSPTAGARTHMVMGLIVMDAVAFAVPAAESPLTDIGSDWLWWTSQSFHADGTAVTPLDEAGGAVWSRVEVDNKAMRKIQSNQVLALVLANSPSAGTATIIVNGVLRFLFKK